MQAAALIRAMALLVQRVPVTMAVAKQDTPQTVWALASKTQSIQTGLAMAIVTTALTSHRIMATVAQQALLFS
jgi:hypothetical protein